MRIIQIQKFHLFFRIDETKFIVNARAVVNEDSTFDFDVTVHCTILVEETTNVFG